MLMRPGMQGLMFWTDLSLSRSTAVKWCRMAPFCNLTIHVYHLLSGGIGVALSCGWGAALSALGTKEQRRAFIGDHQLDTRCGLCVFCSLT